jgi:hypothetical protein
MVWKQRNECVFEGTRPSVGYIVLRIKEEANLWDRASAPGLWVILPQTWDMMYFCGSCKNSSLEACNDSSFYPMK